MKELNIPPDASFLINLHQTTQLLEAAGAPSTDLETLLLLIQVGAVVQPPPLQAASAEPQDQTARRGSLRDARNSTPSTATPNRLPEGSTSARSGERTQRPRAYTSTRAAPTVASPSPLVQSRDIHGLHQHFKASCSLDGSPALHAGSSRVPGPSPQHTPVGNQAPRSRAPLQRAPTPPIPSPYGGTEWFAIVVGIKVGVVYSWTATAPYVIGYSGNIYKGYKSKERALQRFWEEYPQNIRSGTGIVLGIEQFDRLTPRPGLDR